MKRFKLTNSDFRPGLPWISAPASDILVCAINPVLILVISQYVKGMIPEKGFMLDPESGHRRAYLETLMQRAPVAVWHCSAQGS